MLVYCIVLVGWEQLIWERWKHILVLHHFSQQLIAENRTRVHALSMLVLTAEKGVVRAGVLSHSLSSAEQYSWEGGSICICCKNWESLWPYGPFEAKNTIFLLGQGNVRRPFCNTSFLLFLSGFCLYTNLVPFLECNRQIHIQTFPISTELVKKILLCTY